MELAGIGISVNGGQRAGRIISTANNMQRWLKSDDQYPHIPHTDCRCPACAPGEPMGQTILLVEDSDDVALGLMNALTRAGHTVVVAETEFQAEIRLFNGGIDFVLTDGHFPVYRNALEAMPLGIELLRFAKKKGIPGILYSGDEILVAQAQREGFRALLKPSSMTELLEAVGEARR